MGELAELCSVSAVESGSVRRIEVGGWVVALVRLGDAFYAIDDRCSHEGASLSLGRVDGARCMIRCWKHGSAFSLDSGRPDSPPATRAVPVYRTEVIEGCVYAYLDTGSRQS